MKHDRGGRKVGEGVLPDQLSIRIADPRTRNHRSDTRSMFRCLRDEVGDVEEDGDEDGDEGGDADEGGDEGGDEDGDANGGKRDEEEV